MAIFEKRPCQKVVKLHLYCHNFWNTCPKWIKIVFLDSSCDELSKNINFIWFLKGSKFELMMSLWHQLADLHKFVYSFKKTRRSYLSMPNFKSISFKMAVLQGGGGGKGRISPPHVCVIQKTPSGIGLMSEYIFRNRKGSTNMELTVWVGGESMRI